MHSDQMSDYVASFFERANDLQWRKNRDYHPERVAFLEILRTAAECNITVEQDLWAKIRKQYIALHSFAIEGKLESEAPESRMIDIAVYMGMFSFWVAHKERIVKDAFDYMTMQHCEEPVARGVTCGRCMRCKFLFWLLTQTKALSADQAQAPRT